MSKFTKRIDQTLEHVRESKDWAIVKMPQWVLQYKFLTLPWYTNVWRRHCVACNSLFGGGEAWSVLINVKMFKLLKATPEDDGEVLRVNVCSHCAPSESLLATRLQDSRTQTHIAALL
jgi:hypothetical protein